MTPVTTHVGPPPTPLMDVMCKCGHVARGHVVTPNDTGLGPPHIGSCMHITVASGILGVVKSCPCMGFEHVGLLAIDPAADFNAYYGMLLAQWQELREHVAAIERLLQSVCRLAGPR